MFGIRHRACLNQLRIPSSELRIPPMFFRFGVPLALVMLISLAGTILEKRNLELKRSVSRQHYRLAILEEQYAARRVEAQRLGAPVRLIDELDADLLAPVQPEPPAKPPRKSNHKKPNHPAQPLRPSF
jgi:hypothetical protein